MFDFLFLVGRLEEQGHNGDSAETALLACNEKPEKVYCIVYVVHYNPSDLTIFTIPRLWSI